MKFLYVDNLKNFKLCKLSIEELKINIKNIGYIINNFLLLILFNR